MSEAPVDKTKRKVIEAIEKYQPTHQITFYFNEEDEPEYALEAFKNLRKKLSAQCPDVTLIWWLRVYMFGEYLVPMFQIFSTDKIDRKTIDRAIGYTDLNIELNYNRRAWDESKRTRWCSAIKNQKLHNLKGYFGKAQVQRWAVTNKPKTVSVDKQQTELLDKPEIEWDSIEF